MALYHQLKFPSTFIEYRCVSEWKGVVVISNFDSLEAPPLQIYRPRQLPSLPRPKFAPAFRMYSVMAIFNSSIVWGLFEYTEFVIAPQRKKSGGERSGDLGGQMVLEMILSANSSSKSATDMFAV